MKMIALKPIRRLQPGTEFEVRSSAEARALKALGKAKDAPPPEPADLERDALRADAARLGVEVDGRWGAARLREAIAAAAPPETLSEHPVPRFYRRRDMVPEES